MAPPPPLNPALYNRFADFDRRIQALQAQGADLLARSGQLRDNVADIAASRLDGGGAMIMLDPNALLVPPPEDNAELVLMIQQLTQQITDLRNNLSGLQARENNFGAAGGAGANGDGVPQNVLDGLPRERLTERSSILKEGTLTLVTFTGGPGETGETKTDLQVVPAEFGAIQANLQNVRLVATQQQTATRPDDTSSADHTGAILVLRRGEITFAQKARAAQQRGALGLVIVNDRATPWPYIMTDSTNEAADIAIPVVMVPQGTHFPTENSSNTNCSLRIQENADMTCCVCTESFCNTITIHLPKCHHRFHEACALTWLSRHNSCPYCRSVVHTTSAGQVATNHRVQDYMAAAFYG
jgi:PA domain/Ring finger domain